MAASIRRIISFPAPCRFHPDACKRRQGLTGWSSITPSSTAAAASAQSSAAFISRRSCENYPSPKPLPRQIPIGQPPLSRGFLLRGLSDAGPLNRVDRSRRAGIRNPSRKRPLPSGREEDEFAPGLLKTLSRTASRRLPDRGRSWRISWTACQRTNRPRSAKSPPCTHLTWRS